MKSYHFFLVIAVACLVASPQTQTCPTDHFSAIFVGTVDEVSSGRRGFSHADPELKFFKEILGFRDDAIQHTTVDAMKFFNDTYGLNFFPSAPNDLNQRFFENAIMEPFTFSEDIKFFATTNNWIRTGSTRSAFLQVGFMLSTRVTRPCMAAMVELRENLLLTGFTALMGVNKAH